MAHRCWRGWWRSRRRSRRSSRSLLFVFFAFLCLKAQDPRAVGGSFLHSSSSEGMFESRSCPLMHKRPTERRKDRPAAISDAQRSALFPESVCEVFFVKNICRTTSHPHLHLCISTFSPISLLIFTSTFTTAHLHLCSSSSSHIYISAHLHICTSTSLLIFTSSHLHHTASPLALLNFLS